MKNMSKKYDYSQKRGGKKLNKLLYLSILLLFILFGCQQENKILVEVSDFDGDIVIDGSFLAIPVLFGRMGL
jgi:hypothetical protein